MAGRPRKKSIATKWQGKRRKDLTPTQLRLYNREAQRRSVEKRREAYNQYMRDYMRNRRKKAREPTPIDEAATA